MNKEAIIRDLKKARIMEVEIYGMPKEIDYLCNNLKKNETILKAALGILSKKYGVFILTTNRLLFLFQISNEVQIIECDLKKIVSIVHKGQYPELLTIRTADNTLILEDVRPPFGEDVYYIISDFLEVTKNKSPFF